jgi:hypothetical protein
MDAEDTCTHFSFDVSACLVRLDKQVGFYFGTCNGSDRLASYGHTPPFFSMFKTWTTATLVLSGEITVNIPSRFFQVFFMEQ